MIGFPKWAEINWPFLKKSVIAYLNGFSAFCLR